MTKALVGILLTLICLSNCTGAEPLNWDALRVANNNRKTFVEADIPQSIRSLEGKPIQIRGYMVIHSVNKTQGIEKFAIWAETAENPLNVNHWEALPVHKLVMVEMEAGLSTEFIVNSPIEISGTISVDLRRIDGAIVSIYKITATKVIKAMKHKGLFPAADYGC